LRPTPEKFRVLRTGETISKDKFDALNEIFDVYNAFNESVHSCFDAPFLTFSSFLPTSSSPRPNADLFQRPNQC
jgi:hypothetical protein